MARPVQSSRSGTTVRSCRVEHASKCSCRNQSKLPTRCQLLQPLDPDSSRRSDTLCVSEPLDCTWGKTSFDEPTSNRANGASLCGSWNVFSWEQPWQSLSAWGRHQACSRIHEFRSLPIVCQPNPRLFGSCGHTPIKSPGEQNVENTQLEPPTALFAARQPFATDRYQSSTPSRCMLPHKDRKSLRIVVSPACRIARRPGR